MEIRHGPRQRVEGGANLAVKRGIFDARSATRSGDPQRRSCGAAPRLPEHTKAAAEAAEAEATATYEAARDRLREEGPDPVTKKKGGAVAPTKEAMISKVDARVDGGKTSAAKGAEWLCRMTVDATFWAKVNKRCVPQAKRKKKDARRGVGSQKKARTA